MTNLKLETVRCKLFTNLNERLEQDSNLSSCIMINYNGHNRYGDINIKFMNHCKEEDKIKFLQIINEEYAKVYQDDVERQTNIGV